MTRGALLIGAAVGGVGLYLWASGGLTTLQTWFRDVTQGTPLPPPPAPPLPGPLGFLGPTGGEGAGPLAWMDGRPEDPGLIRFSVMG